MELFADRFVVSADGRARDLATACDVELVVSPAGGLAEQARWEERCSWFTSVRHHALATLIDLEGRVSARPHLTALLQSYRGIALNIQRAPSTP